MSGAAAPWPISVAAHEAMARERMTPALDAYINGGAGDEITLAANRHAWAQRRLWPRVLACQQAPDLRTTWWGHTWPTPLLIAPMAQQGWLHPEAELGTALAASALGIGMVLSMQSHTPLQEVSRAVRHDAGRGPLWFQLYHAGDRCWTLELAQQAADAGYEGLVWTVDAPIQGVRDRERQTGLPPPLNQPMPHRPPHAGTPHDLPGLMAQAARWSDVEWLAAHSPLPIVLKGVIHPDDAAEACHRGVGGLVVSNHGGRVLDTVVPTADALPAVVDAVAQRVPVWVDGGIRRGADVFKALALGATGVLVGRPVAHGLFNGGARGVAHVLRLLIDELSATMALCGTPHVGAISSAYVHDPGFTSLNTNNSHL